jgi:signal transduction histidine kinase
MGDAPVRRVVIRVADAGPLVHVEVEDTGPGIAPELQASIFEPFVRAAAKTIPGSGLGLATVKKSSPRSARPDAS